MTTAKFFSNSNRSMYLGVLKRNAPLGIFYGVLMIVLFPLLYIITLLTADRNINEWNYNDLQTSLFGYSCSYTDFSAIAMILICAIMPIVFGVIIFSYMHSRKSTDVYHALPMKRQSVFSANYFAGLTLLWIPIILSYLIILITGAFNANALGASYSVLRILSDLVTWMVVVSAVFTITATVAVLAGTSFDTVLYSLAMCGMYPVLLMLAKLAVETLLLGFDGNWPSSILREVNLMSLSPFTLQLYRIVGFGETYDSYFLFNSVAIFVWAIITAILFFVANKIYARRKSELAGSSTESSALSKIVQYALVFACGILFGILLGSSFNDNKVVYILGVLIGGGIAYTAYEAVLARGFRTFPKAFVQMGISVGLTLAFVCVFLTGGLGYETRVPATEEIQSVSINYNGRYESRAIYQTEDDAENTVHQEGMGGSQDSLSMKYNVRLSSPEAIQILRDYHRAVIHEQQKSQGKIDWSQTTNFRPIIVYQLKNGSTVNRSYSETTSETMALLGGLEDLDEFRQQTNPAFLLEAGDLEQLSVGNRLRSFTETTITEAQQGMLLTALREDAKNQSLSDITTETYAELGYIGLSINRDKFYGDRLMPGDKTSYILITEGYTNTIQWLKENQFYDAMQIDPEKLTKAQICKELGSARRYRSGNNDSLYFDITREAKYEGTMPDFDKESWLAVEDKALIQELFAKSKNYGKPIETPCYWVYFEYDGVTADFQLYLELEDIPQALKAEVEKKMPR